MKKIYFMSCMMMILAALPVLAQDGETEVSRDMHTGETFEFKDDVYLVTINSYDEVILGYNDQFIVVRNGTCTKKTIYYDFCVDEIDFDDDKNEPVASINVYSYEPEIKIRRTISVNPVIIGDETIITATVSNNGYNTAYDVIYTDTFPADINISIESSVYKGPIEVRRDNEVMLENGSVMGMYTVYWKDDIEAGDSVTFAYKLTPRRPVDQPFSAIARYFNGYEDVIEESDDIVLEALPYFDLKASIMDDEYKNRPGELDINRWESKNLVYSGEDLILIVTIDNNFRDNESIEVPELRFFFPKGMRYLEPYSMKIYNNASDESSSFLSRRIEFNKVNEEFYNWSGEIPQYGKRFVMKVRAAQKGDEHVIRIAGDFKRDEFPNIYDYSVLKTFEVKREDIEIESNFEEGKEFSSGQNAYFTIYLVNPNEYANLTDIDVSMSIPWVEKKKHFVDTLKSANYSDIFNGNIAMPDVTGPTTLNYYVNVSYTTPFGERLSETFQRNVKIQPLSPFNVKHDIDGSEYDSSSTAEIDNKETEITVKIKNTLKKDIEGIVVTEVFDKNLNPIEKISHKIITLNKDDTTDVFKYKINPPDKSIWQNYTLRTYISYIYENQRFNNSFDLNIKVKPKKMDISIIKEIFEDDVAKGQIAHFKYKITNTEDEVIKDITLHFPFQYETDIVGQTTFRIDEILPEDTVIVNNEERVRMKFDKDIRIEKTNVSFFDESGNFFNDSSTVERVNVKNGSLQSPAIIVDKTAPLNATAGDNFTVDLKVSNIGKSHTWVTVKDEGYEYRFRLAAGSEKMLSHRTHTDKTGYIELSKAVVNYTHAGFDYHTASEIPEVYSKDKVVRKPAPPRPVIEEVPEIEPEKRVFNKKYIYLAGFIILMCLVIWFIIRRPKKEGFEFLEG
ncbi:hypothetical protein ACFL96_14350 [Thermoproteota archaeon]